MTLRCLRALLIRKGVKQNGIRIPRDESLRALLIRKGVKRIIFKGLDKASLRALLIRKGVKQKENQQSRSQGLPH